VPFFPAICVEVGAAAVVDGSAAADDVIADAEDDIAELEAWLEFVLEWQPTPISANTAIPTENNAVLCFVIARISSFRILLEFHRPRRGRRAQFGCYADPILFGAKSCRPITAHGNALLIGRPTFRRTLLEYRTKSAPSTPALQCAKCRAPVR
jgi:hypothetical protein